MLDQVHAISFDLDDTLWPCAPTIMAAEAACLAWLAQSAPRLAERHDLASLRAHRLALGCAQPDIAHDLTEVRRRSLAELLVAAGYDVALAGQACDVFRTARNRVTPYADVIPGLARLRDRYTLVSVTNGNAQVEHTPLCGAFHHSLTAAEVGAAKPDPAIFHEASRRTGLPLSAFLHAGDDPLRDVEAARVIGMSTAWIDRGVVPWPNDIAPADIVVHDLAQLDALLRGCAG